MEVGYFSASDFLGSIRHSFASVSREGIRFVKRKNKITIYIFLALILIPIVVFANHILNEYVFKKVDFKLSSDPTYKTSCGGCHFLYPPELLPSSSWKTILDQLSDHFGEQVSLDPKSRESISKYLQENGADRSSSKNSGKIMDSLNGRTTSRITEIPIFKKKHQGIKPEIINRKAIGSLSKCTACHKKAEQGYFNQVEIPQ